jgi:hypothetical protein
LKFILSNTSIPTLYLGYFICKIATKTAHRTYVPGGLTGI